MAFCGSCSQALLSSPSLAAQFLFVCGIRSNEFYPTVIIFRLLCRAFAVYLILQYVFEYSFHSWFFARIITDAKVDVIGLCPDMAILAYQLRKFIITSWQCIAQLSHGGKEKFPCEIEYRISALARKHIVFSSCYCQQCNW